MKYLPLNIILVVTISQKAYFENDNITLTEIGDTKKICVYTSSVRVQE